MESTITQLSDGLVWQNEKGELHRLDGPAVESSNGDKWWLINGNYHREDGPAIEYIDGAMAYFLNGIQYTKEDYEEEIVKLKLSRIKDL